MKLLIFYTKEYEPLKNKFVSSIVDNYDVVDKLANFKRELRAGGGSCITKITLVIDFIRENYGSCVIYSDIDVLFFKKTELIITAALNGCDVVFQREYEAGGVNGGFFAMRCNDVVLAFFEEVLRQIQKTHDIDQAVINKLLYKGKYPIRWGRLPPEIFNCTQWRGEEIKSYYMFLETLASRRFRPRLIDISKDYLITPQKALSPITVKVLQDKEICLYHANFAAHKESAMEMKLEHLGWVERYMNSGNRWISSWPFQLGTLCLKRMRRVLGFRPH